ncbi:hypothetical protein BH11PSE11_BH11PSE11_25590 [soil metagenome]
MIVCICNNISEREVRQAVDLGVTSMSELSDGLGVATCCGKCRECATQYLSECVDRKAGARKQEQSVLTRFNSVAA